MKNLIKILCAILLFVVACKKEDTPAPVVVNGTNGTNGSNGVNATSTSVLYSDWMSPGTGNGNTSGTTSTETGDGNGSGSTTSGTTQFFTIKAAAITQEILDKGVVMAFAKLAGDGNNVRSLPTTTLISSYMSIWDFTLTLGQIQFSQFSGDPKGLPTMSSSNQFRYVIIPPTKHLRLSKPLKDMTYNEICDMFNIPK